MNLHNNILARSLKKAFENLLIKKSFLNIAGLLAKFGAIFLGLSSLVDVVFSIISATETVELFNYGLEGGIYGACLFVPMARVAAALDNASSDRFSEAAVIQKEIIAQRQQKQEAFKAKKHATKSAQTAKKSQTARPTTSGKVGTKAPSLQSTASIKAVAGKAPVKAATTSKTAQLKPLVAELKVAPQIQPAATTKVEDPIKLSSHPSALTPQKIATKIDVVTKADPKEKSQENVAARETKALAAPLAKKSIKKASKELPQSNDTILVTPAPQKLKALPAPKDPATEEPKISNVVASDAILVTPAPQKLKALPAPKAPVLEEPRVSNVVASDAIIITPPPVTPPPVTPPSAKLTTESTSGSSVSEVKARASAVTEDETASVALPPSTLVKPKETNQMVSKTLTEQIEAFSLAEAARLAAKKALEHNAKIATAADGAISPTGEMKNKVMPEEKSAPVNNSKSSKKHKQRRSATVVACVVPAQHESIKTNNPDTDAEEGSSPSDETHPAEESQLIGSEPHEDEGDTTFKSSDEARSVKT